MDTASFEDFVRDQKIFTIPEHPGQPWMGPMNSWFNQLEWIKDENGQVVCDCLRLEYLDHDLSSYFHQSIRPHRKNSTRKEYDYRRVYTEELAEIVERTFQDDIEYFGFGFDGPATRNIAVAK
jgi:hypothetical protein